MARAAINRELSLEERTLVEWLIANDSQEAQKYVSQMPDLRVVGACGGGCPTVDFSVNSGGVPLVGGLSFLLTSSE
jgi:hypothetical protein